MFGLNLYKLLYYDYHKVLKKIIALDKEEIFGFGDTFFQKYFEMKISHCTYTKNNFNNCKNIQDTNLPYLIFTDNKYYTKNT